MATSEGEQMPWGIRGGWCVALAAATLGLSGILGSVRVRNGHRRP